MTKKKATQEVVTAFKCFDKNLQCRGYQFEVGKTFTHEGKARAAAGGAIVLCHRNDRGELLHIRASKVGENGVTADVWYTLSAAGEFVQVEG